MFVAGLTGGIGSGKSTFASLLAQRGAEVIDADQLGRAALDPGKPAWHSVVDQFGDEILAAGGLEVDRRRLAAIVFEDPNKLAALNAIVHPAITKGIADSLEVLQGTDEIVILDAALIVELGLHEALDSLIVVTASEGRRRERLQRDRGMTPDEITARIGAQATEEELLERADIVVRNDGNAEALEAQADRVWAELQERRDG
ncbi:MAG: dephospho-CoA kinase [Blastocatellia bacterium]|jgi:dephospho-CoA kinase|nr:dephospho-CoA kinase [Blastocatellia bacterium]